MDDLLRPCPDCRAPFDTTDNYCRQCGMFLTVLRETAVTAAEPTLPAGRSRERAALPAPVKKAVTAVAIGTALQVGMSLTGKYVARQAAKQAVSAIRPRPAKSRRPARITASQAPVVEARPARMDPYDGAAAVSETVIVRRIWVRRG